MTKNDSSSGHEAAEQAESLSATGLFLRAFDAKSESGPEPSLSNSPDLKMAPSSDSVDLSGDRPAGQSSEPTEFTRMFQKLDSTPTSTASRETSPQPVSVKPTAVKAEAQPSGDQDLGEFTRIFIAGSTPAANPPAKRPTPPQGSSRAKGFSSPGASDSASAEGSFTQLFKAIPSPALPKQAAAPVQAFAPAPPAAMPPDLELPFKSERVLKSSEHPRPTPQDSPSVTSLLASLSSADSLSPASRQPEPVPYRPEPLPSHPGMSQTEQQESANPGGVTRLIERLAQPTPAPATAPPQSPVSPTAPPDPGEFTRMIMGPPPSVDKVAPAEARLDAPAAIPLAPRAAAKPAVATPAFKALELPIPPKPAPPAPPVPAAPRGRLEAMVPILLVINTFLLIVILLVAVFSLKAR